MRRIEMYEVEGENTRVAVTRERISIKVGRSRSHHEWDEILGDVLDAVWDIPLDVPSLRGRLFPSGTLTLRTGGYSGKKVFKYDAQTGQATWAADF